jgi:ribosomal protein S18 acetylase RimI-like enzyme
MNLPVTLRDATLWDQEFVDSLTRFVMQDYVLQTWSLLQEHEAYFTKNAFDLQTTKIIQLEGRDIGRLSVLETDDYTLVDNIHVWPEFQGLGIGKALIEVLIGQSHTRGAYVKLQVLRVNPAKMLYERLGFRIYAEDAERLYMRTYVHGQ